MQTYEVVFRVHLTDTISKKETYFLEIPIAIVNASIGTLEDYCVEMLANIEYSVKILEVVSIKHP